MKLHVVIPDGLFAGDAFTVCADNGQEFTVSVPDGSTGGDSLTVDLPVDEAAPAAVNIIVPDGCYAGDIFTVEFEGRSFEIGVPDGCGPGDELTVEVPEESPLASSCSSCSQQPSGSPASAPAAEDDFKCKPGQRVELLRSDGAFSPGTVVLGFEGVLDVMYKVQLDNGLFKEAVPEEELSAELCEAGDLFDGFG